MSVTVKEEDLLSNVEAALKAHHLSATRFGYLVAGDPTLVSKMRKGRKPRSKLRQQIERALVRLEKDGEL